MWEIKPQERVWTKGTWCDKMTCVKKPVQPGVWASESKESWGKEIKLYSEAIMNWSEGQKLGKSV